MKVVVRQSLVNFCRATRSHFSRNSELHIHHSEKLTLLPVGLMKLCIAYVIVKNSQLFFSIVYNFHLGFI